MGNFFEYIKQLEKKDVFPLAFGYSPEFNASPELDEKQEATLSV